MVLNVSLRDSNNIWQSFSATESTLKQFLPIESHIKTEHKFSSHFQCKKLCGFTEKRQKRSGVEIGGLVKTSANSHNDWIYNLRKIYCYLDRFSLFLDAGQPASEEYHPHPRMVGFVYITTLSYQI